MKQMMHSTRTRRLLNRGLLAVAASLLFPHAVSAALLYRVTIDTSSMPAGAPGGMELQFNQSVYGDAPAAMATVSDFSLAGGGVLEAPTDVIGSVTGSLVGAPFALTFSNGDFINYIFHGLTYGSSLAFSVEFAGDFVSSSDTSGTTAFAVSLYDEIGNLLLPDDSDIATQTFYLTAPGGVVRSANPDVSVTAVPEPQSLLLLVVGLLGVALMARTRQPTAA